MVPVAHVEHRGERREAWIGCAVGRETDRVHANLGFFCLLAAGAERGADELGAEADAHDHGPCRDSIVDQ